MYYNADDKLKFLESRNDGVYRIGFETFFRGTASTESDLEKDLYEFTEKEFEYVLKNYNAYSTQSVKKYVSFFNTYVEWAAGEGLISTNLALIEHKDYDWFSQFVNKSKRINFSEDEFNQIVDDLRNYSDKFILQALYEGISGKEFSEIRNLKMSDFKLREDGQYWVALENDGEVDEEPRAIPVSHKLYKYAQEADNTLNYYNKNGDSIAFSTETELIDSKYILKIAKKGRHGSGGDKAERSLISRRILMIKDTFDMPLLKAEDIRRSGMVAMAMKMYKQNDGFVTKTDIKKICKQYDTPMASYNGYQYYFTKMVIRKIKEPLMEKYGIDLEEHLNLRDN